MNLRRKKENVNPNSKNNETAVKRNNKKVNNRAQNVKANVISKSSGITPYLDIKCSQIMQSDDTIYDSVKRRNALRLKDTNSGDEKAKPVTEKTLKPKVTLSKRQTKTEVSLQPKKSKISDKKEKNLPEKREEIQAIIISQGNATDAFIKPTITRKPQKEQTILSFFKPIENLCADSSDSTIYDAVKQRTAQRKRKCSSEESDRSDADGPPKPTLKEIDDVGSIRNHVNKEPKFQSYDNKVNLKTTKTTSCHKPSNKIATSTKRFKGTVAKISSDSSLSAGALSDKTTTSRRKPRKKLMKRKARKESQLPPDIFGFNSSGEFDSDTEPYSGDLYEFDPSKPFRLALYVKPSNRPRIDPSLIPKLQSMNPSFNITRSNATLERKKPFESFCVNNRVQWKMPMCSTPIVKKPAKKSSLVQQKITATIPLLKNAGEPNISEFMAVDSDSETQLQAKTPSPVKVNETVSAESTEETTSEGAEPIRFYKPSRRSYIKKSKPLEEDLEDEPSSDEIQKSLEKEKRKRVRTKKAIEEEKQFEKWSASINSEFNEVEKFDLSICPELQ